MDYDVEMLKLYFKEKNFTKEQIDKLLDENPFNLDYIMWEKQNQNNNKTLIHMIKKICLFDSNSPIQEIVNHENNSLSKFLSNPCEIKISPIGDNNSNIKIGNKLLLMKGFIPNQRIILKKADNYNIPFIVGVCSKDTNFYNRMKLFYQELMKEIKFSKIIEREYNDQKICILTKNKKH